MKCSQFGEDDHIAAIFDEIGEGSKILCDIGARLNGSNSAYLLTERGWSGVLVDKRQDHCTELESLPAKVVCATATIDNINELVPHGTQFLSIDVDGPDWWLWGALYERPALVVVETNPMPGFFVACPPFSKANYGMSVDAARWMGERKGYTFVGRTAVNCFFVRGDCKYRLPPIGTHSGVNPKQPRGAFCA